ncbi:MAG: hypothetical protein F6J93_33420 [Oscillatoria sp. SIO1A7]|nr:hypothetical protein [Oscillatoria sp. SIO1A7]
MEKILDSLERDKMLQEKDNWLNSDLSGLGEYEPYEWETGELEEGKPVKYVEGVGLVIESSDRS